MSLAIIFMAVSSTFSLPPGLLSATCWVESKHNVRAINANDGGSASHGACQIKLATARMLGYTGTAQELYKPYTNIYWAGKLLRHQLNRYDGDHRRAVAAYNSGSVKYNYKGQLVNRYYVNKVVLAWFVGK